MSKVVWRRRRLLIFVQRARQSPLQSFTAFDQYEEYVNWKRARTTCVCQRHPFTESVVRQTLINNPWTDTTKLCTHDYMSIINLCTQFGNDRFSGDLSAHACFITLLYLFKPQSIYPFPSRLSCDFHRSNAWNDIDGWWLKRRVLAQGSAFWVCGCKDNTLRVPMTPEFFDALGKSQLKR